LFNTRVNNDPHDIEEINLNIYKEVPVLVYQELEGSSCMLLFLVAHKKITEDMLKNTDNAYIVRANNPSKFLAILLPTLRL
jgi:hypothetical protein